MDLTLPAKPRAWPARSSRLRHSEWDALLIGLSLVHAAIVLAVPSILTIAVLMWWNANTIAHNFIHRPFFRSRTLNRAYALWSSVLLGIPQTFWRERHLGHHGGRLRRPSAGAISVEVALIAGLWTLMAALAPRLFVTVYLPGYAIGLLLCLLHGHFEHAGGRTTSAPQTI